jgi:hypothetical protein
VLSVYHLCDFFSRHIQLLYVYSMCVCVNSCLIINLKVLHILIFHFSFRIRPLLALPSLEGQSVGTVRVVNHGTDSRNDSISRLVVFHL